MGGLGQQRPLVLYCVGEAQTWQRDATEGDHMYSIFIDQITGDFILCTARPRLEAAELSIKRHSPRYHSPFKCACY